MSEMNNIGSIRPTMLLVEDEEELRVELRKFLVSLGYRVLMAQDEIDALELLHERPSPIALILVNQRMVSDEALAAGQRIRSRAKIGEQVPVVVIPYEYTDGKEGTDQSVGDNGYKSYMTSTDQLESLLSRCLLPTKSA